MVCVCVCVCVCVYIYIYNMYFKILTADFPITYVLTFDPRNERFFPYILQWKLSWCEKRLAKCMKGSCVNILKYRVNIFVKGLKKTAKISVSLRLESEVFWKWIKGRNVSAGFTEPYI